MSWGVLPGRAWSSAAAGGGLPIDVGAASFVPLSEAKGHAREGQTDYRLTHLILPSMRNLFGRMPIHA